MQVMCSITYKYITYKQHITKCMLDYSSLAFTVKTAMEMTKQTVF